MIKNSDLLSAFPAETAAAPIAFETERPTVLSDRASPRRAAPTRARIMSLPVVSIAAAAPPAVPAPKALAPPAGTGIAPLAALASLIVVGGLGVLFLSGAHLAGWRPGAAIAPAPVSASLVWLGYINVAVAIFNMIPAYPLDGGRVLRAVVWRMTQNLVAATNLVAGVGRVMAVALIGFGLFQFIYAGAFGGLWLAFIGWFMADAAAATQIRMRQIPVAELPKQRLSA